MSEEMRETQDEVLVQATADPGAPAGASRILDLEALLAPVAGADPAGEYLRYADTYDMIKEARRMDDPTLPQGVWESDLKRADWSLVVRACVEALEKKSKDLQLAAWLTEALLALHGFSGLKEGLELILGLCERYWDSVHPRPDGEDLELRLSPFHWINAKLSTTLKLAPVTDPRGMDASVYAFMDWESANHLEQLAQRDKAAYASAEKEGKVTRAKFLGSVMFTNAGFFARLAGDLRRSLEATSRMEALLDERCGKSSPSLVKFRETLKEIHRLAEKFRQDKDGEANGQAGDQAESAQAQAEGQDEVQPGRRSGRIRSRSDAYRMLSEAADYLMATEPHSPAPFLVKRAVSWGNMSLTELLEELVNNQSDLAAIYTLLGMRSRSGE